MTVSRNSLGTGVFLTKWGTSGPNGGQFNVPQGLDIDSDGNVYVADLFNDRIQKFTNTGVFIMSWGSPSGTGDGQLDKPRDIAIDSSDNVYVTDPGNHRVQKFTSSGGFITTFGSVGSEDGQFEGPFWLDVNAAGKVVYTVQQINPINSVQVFSLDTTPPPAPTLLLPANGSLTNDNTPTFDWSDITTDPSTPITYNLQVNDSSDQTALSGISAAGSSTFTPFNSLPDGQYTWHVRAADNSGGGGWDTGNKGPFSSIFSFTVDTTAASIASTYPGTGGTSISTTPCVCITFSEKMTTSTINTNTITLKDSSNTAVPGQVVYDFVNNVASFNPSAPLSYSTDYTATVKGELMGLKMLVAI